MMQASEEKLIRDYRLAIETLETAKEVQKKAQADKDKIENALYEALTAENKESTATYEGVGCVSIGKPRVFASCLKDNEPILANFLKENERSDMIREYVFPQTLSTFVKERLESGEDIPEFIQYYLKPIIRLTK